MRAKQLFKPVVGQKRLDLRFEHLRTSPVAKAAREMLNDVFRNFVDTDGNFVEQFQTTGFDSRFFELYLHAYLSRSGYQIDRHHPNPDFLITRDGITVALEATTVNASRSGAVAKFGKTIKDLTEEQRGEYGANELPIRFGSALLSKLRRRYWKMPHCSSVPFVIAIEAFHDEGSLSFSDSALATYLSGLRHSASWDEHHELIFEAEKVASHQLGDKEIPSGFFGQPETEFLSAVLFTNSGTSAKFSRMGYQSGYANDTLNIKRLGRCYNPNPSAMDSTLFSYDLDDPPFIERWGDGLVVFHNSKALRPLPRLFFDADSEWVREGNDYVPYIRGWNTYRSETLVNHVGKLKKRIPKIMIMHGPQMVEAIDEERFHLLNPSARSSPKLDETGWFADQSEGFLGLVFKNAKSRWSFVVFARDEYFLFRPIGRKSGYRMRVLACEGVQFAILNYLLRPQRIFPRDKKKS